MLIIDFVGTEPTAEELSLLLHPWVSGVIFFARNILSYTHLQDMIAQVRSVRPDLLITIDHEGGRVQRLKDGVTVLPPMATLGEHFDKDPQAAIKAANDLGQKAASELGALDIDLSFAPVLDLQNPVSKIIGDRGFHRDPKVVVELASAFVRGMNQAGMAAVGKHFPGHGSIMPDSHVELPVDDRTFEALHQDLYPFQQMCERGIQAIMPAHIVFPQIDDVPVGFSKHWLQDILRQQYGFQGVIISDDLDMAGARALGSIERRLGLAIEAGCDLILICNAPVDARAAIRHAESIAERPVRACAGSLRRHHIQHLNMKGSTTYDHAHS